MLKLNSSKFLICLEKRKIEDLSELGKFGVETALVESTMNATTFIICSI